MQLIAAAKVLASLAQPSRLRVFRVLVGAPEEGLCAGDISERLRIPKPTLSFHLKELSNAGLIEARKDGRSLFYGIRAARMRQLMTFLSNDCCQGRPELCLPQSPSPCCETADGRPSHH